MNYNIIKIKNKLYVMSQTMSTVTLNFRENLEFENNGT